jgi:hypothetical protein
MALLGGGKRLVGDWWWVGWMDVVLWERVVRWRGCVFGGRLSEGFLWCCLRRYDVNSNIPSRDTISKCGLSKRDNRAIWIV